MGQLDLVLLDLRSSGLVLRDYIVDHLVFLKTLRTTGLPVRNTPLINIPKGFSSEMTLEVA